MLAHGDGSVLRRAVSRLTTPNCGFFVHVDAKTCLRDFGQLGGQNVSLLNNRIPVFWGEYSQVEAILVLIREAIAASTRYDYFVLLSGSDYPLRTAHYIETFLELNAGREFISLVKMPAPGKPLSRVDTLWYPVSTPLRHYCARALAKLNLARRDHKKYLGCFEVYSGSTWWALTRPACEHILEFTSAHAHVGEFFRNTFGADESYFHSIIGNGPFLECTARNVTFTDWSDRGQGRGHPAMISHDHLASFAAQRRIIDYDVNYGYGEVLFARKFTRANFELLDRIDAIADAAG